MRGVDGPYASELRRFGECASPGRPCARRSVRPPTHPPARRSLARSLSNTRTIRSLASLCGKSLPPCDMGRRTQISIDGSSVSWVEIWKSKIT